MNNKAQSNSKLQEIFSLHHDQAHPDAIDNAIRANVRVSGTNLWVLMFAIAIASIGLNVNSTAVIIGAMLISPLMGPIVGIGYGVAVSDVSLIRLAIRNMLIFITISLLTATLYFAITPLQQAQSELLARTQPNLWDVLIAFFGGSAGIIAITRKEMSNVVPGVAIATALMPPLCTAGFGLAHGYWDYFWGAFYLFIINCVFIAFATLLFSHILKLPRRGLITKSSRKLQSYIIFSIVLIIMLPSGYLAMKLVQKEIFTTTVTTAINSIQQEEDFYILRSTIDDTQQSVGLIINGTGDAQAISQKLTKKLISVGIKQPQVKVLYAGGSLTNLENVKHELEINQKNSIQLQNQLKQQQDYIETLLIQTANNSNSLNKNVNIIKEIQSQYPEAKTIIVAKGTVWHNQQQNTEVLTNTAHVEAEINTENPPTSVETKPSITDKQDTIIWIKLTNNLTSTERERLHAWLKQRLQDNAVQLIITVSKEEDNTQTLNTPK